MMSKFDFMSKKFLTVDDNNMVSVLRAVSRSVQEQIPQDGKIVFDLSCTKLFGEGPSTYVSHFDELPRTVGEMSVYESDDGFNGSVFQYNILDHTEDYSDELCWVWGSSADNYSIWVNYI